MNLLSLLRRAPSRHPKTPLRRLRPRLEALEDRALPSANPIIIDDFSTNQSPLALTFPPAGTSAASSLTGTGILYDERDLEIDLTAGIIAGNGISSVVSDGSFSYAQDATISGHAILQWDGMDGSPTLNTTGLGGFDLTGAGTQDAFALDVVFDDLPVNLELTVNTNSDDASVAILNLAGGISTQTRFVVPYSAFSPILGAGADFTNVGAISLRIGSSETAPDLVLDSFQTTSLVDATEAVALLNDVNGDTQANPGDTLRYTVTLTNPDDASDASPEGATFTNLTPANTTLVVGSVTTSQGTVTSGNAAGDSDVVIDLAKFADGESATITFDVLIDSPLAGVTQISSQGEVTTDSLTGVLTDDPTLPGSQDATTIAVVANSAPVLGGTVADQAVNDDATLNPFAGVTIADADTPAQTLTVEVQSSDPANGTFTPTSLTASGFTDQGGGLYRFTGTADEAQAAIRLLVFAPTPNQVYPGDTVTTTFKVSVDDGTARPVCDHTTSVVSTSINDRPTGQNHRYATRKNHPLVCPCEGLLRGAQDPDFQFPTVQLVRRPRSGKLILGEFGSFLYVPERGFRGRVRFQFRIFDGMAHSPVYTVVIDVGRGPRFGRVP
jgi:uncharacterized repeat protein (TIGR01451 family)